MRTVVTEYTLVPFTQHQKLDTSVNVPAAEPRRHRAERDRDHTGNAEEPESVVTIDPFVVVTETEPEPDRDRHSCARARETRRSPDLQIRAFAGTPVSLSLELSRKQHVRA